MPGPNEPIPDRLRTIADPGVAGCHTPERRNGRHGSRTSHCSPRKGAGHRMSVHRVAFLVFDGIKMLDVSGPAEVLAEANTLGARYSLRYVSPSGEPVRTSIG